MRNISGLLCLWMGCLLGGTAWAQPPAPRPRAQVDERAMMRAVARYLPQIHLKVLRAWKVKGIPLMELHRRSATIRLWIKANGQLSRILVVQSSGLKKFDQSLLSGIAKAAPFPRPPLILRQLAVNSGFEILFRRRVFLKKRLPLHTQFRGNQVLTNWQKRWIRKKPERRRPQPRPRK